MTKVQVFVQPGAGGGAAARRQPACPLPWLALSFTHHLLPFPVRKPCPCMSVSRAARGLARHERMNRGGRAKPADRTETSVAAAAAVVDSSEEREERFTKYSTGSNRTGSELVEQEAD